MRCGEIAAVLDQLSVRAKLIVEWQDPESPADLASQDLARLPNCGRKAAREIRDWLALNFGIEPPTDHVPVAVTAAAIAAAQNRQRYAAILAQRLSGVPAREIAAQQGITVGRVYQILRLARHRASRGLLVV